MKCSRHFTIFLYNECMQFLCPICHEPLHKTGNSCQCVHHHTFDYNKSGYLYLYQTNKPNHGDNAGMVKARTAFLSSGAYSFLRDFLVEKTEGSETLVDLACGEGYYTSRLHGKEKAGIDLSKEALRHGAKNDKSTQYILSSIFSIPLEDACADTVVTCFAPVSTLEIPRILKPGGQFLLVTPGEDHLYELKQVLYTHPYRNTIKEIPIDLTLEKTEKIEKTCTLDQPTLLALFEMTPYAYKTGKEGMKKLQSLQKLDVTAQFIIRTYRKDS